MSTPLSPPPPVLADTTASSPDARVSPSDFLLSLAKDGRYVSEIAALLAQVVVPYASIFLLPLPPRREDPAARRRRTGSEASPRDDSEDVRDDDGERFIERIRPELHLLAAVIVHSAAFVFYTRNFGRGTEGKGDSTQRSLGMESLNLAYRYRANTPLSTKRHQIEGPRSYVRDYLVRMLSCWNRSRWCRLLFLQTGVPYFFQRVGRGGWSRDLSGLRCGLGPLTTRRRAETEQTREEGSEALQNNDRLRGLARRRLFDEQRRRMLNSSSGTSLPGDSANLDGDSVGRHAMGEMNANRNESSPVGASAQGTSRSLGNPSLDRRLKKLSEFGWKTMRRISLAVSSLSHGAHTLPNIGTSPHLDQYAKTIKWFLRLHLALFYWNGTYPTLAHRLAGAGIRDAVAPYSNTAPSSPLMGAIVANRPNYKPIAALIVLQAAAALAQSTAAASIEVAHSMQVSFFRWQRRRRVSQQPPSGVFALGDGVPLSRTNSERADYMDLIEERVPSNRDAITARRNSRSKKQGPSKTPTQQCGICLNERVSPAAPSGCGHVFCWNCILHWVSNVRAECPLCRAQTLPQDILPLCNYP